MKLSVITVVLFFFVSTSSFAEKNSVNPNDPCDVFFCMAGMFYGERAECQSAINKFFSINSFKKKGRFDPSKTFSQRNDFLSQCPSADRDHVSKIMDKFGRVRG
ncbi:TrbM/KikA/MpfK family conjugal transfer protein [Pectobacterium carotovorum]|uniref:TrbM/KikA/MpfK family conjugal transfer protein n=1 Tax=Pectobacterium carotovorum TaxID=554 RepID=UPI00090773E3|nr:TrbM/KikA/MpfK family conjugal transfer protein [Pectobacterium carotovorum]